MANYNRRSKKGTLSHALDFCDSTELVNIASKNCDLDIKALLEVMKCVKRSREEFKDYMSPLQVAICLGYYGICKQLIEEGAALKTTAISCTPHPLCLALQKGHFDIACLLLKAGADVTLKFDNALPIYYALNNSSCTVQIVKDIIAAGFPPNEMIDCTLGQTSLHVAVFNSCTSIVKYLLSLPVELHKVDKKGLSPLHYAVQKNNLKMVKLLVKNGAKVDIQCVDGYTPLFYAVYAGNYEMVKLLISLGVDIHYVNGSQKCSVMPLHYAANLCKFKISQLLLENGADLNKVSPSSGDTALHYACKANHKNNPTNKVALDCIVEFFVKEGASLEVRNKLGATPLQMAIAAKNTSLAKILIMSGATINSYTTKGDYETTFHLICRQCDKDFIKFCLEYGGDYMAEDKDRLYPCSVSFLRSVWELVPFFGERQQPSDVFAVFKLFWKHGFPFDKTFTKEWIENKSLAFPPKIAAIVEKQKKLFKGVKKSDLQIVKKAIAQGAEVKCCSQDIPRPLHYLALKGSDQLMKEFVSGGVIVNLLNEAGETPLHIAAKCGYIHCCQVLLENGALYNYCDNAKLIKTPLQLAKVEGHTEIEKYLTKIDSYFKALKKGNLKKLSAGMKISRAVMNCCHRDGLTLMGRAIHLNMKEYADHLMKLRLQITS